MSAGSVTSVASSHKQEILLFFTLLELSLIVLAGRVGGSIASRLGQSAAVGEIIIGILLGPSLFGWISPHAFSFVFHSVSPEPMLILSQLGLVLLMFQIGLEFDFAHLTERINRAAVVRVSIACMTVPFASGFVLGFFMTNPNWLRRGANAWAASSPCSSCRYFSLIRVCGRRSAGSTR